jgi:hypothetical protein
MTSRIGVVSDAVSEAVSDELTALASIYDADALYVMQARDGSTVVRCEVPIDLSAGLFFGVCPIILDLASAVQQALAAGATGAGTAVTGDAPRAAALLRRATSAQSGEVDGLRNPRLRLVLVQHLLPVLVELILPVGYPDSAPPNAQVSAPWLSVALAQELAAHAAVLWAELGQSATVYSYLEWVRTEAAAVLLRIAPTPAPSSAPAPASSGSPVEGVMAPAKTPTAVSLRSLSAGRVKLIAAAPGVGAEEALERAEATVERILSETTRLSTGHSPASDVPCLLIGGPCWVSSDPRFRERDSPAAVEHAPAGTDAVEGHQSADLPTLAAIMDALLEHSEEEAARRWASADHDCGVCLSTLKGARCQRIDECGHVFCKTCLRAAVAAALSDFTLGNAKQRVLRASACPDSACHGALSRDDIRLLCVNGPATAAAGATGRTHAGKSTSSLSADGPPPSLAALFERAAAEADVMVATEAAVRAAAGVTDGADVHTTPCPRPRCGHPALLHITAGDASQLLTTAWGLGCVAIEGSPHGIVLDYTAGGAAPRSGHPYRSGEKSPAFFPARRSMGHCTACGFAFCGQCQRSWHGGEPCTYHARTPVDLLLHITRCAKRVAVRVFQVWDSRCCNGVDSRGCGSGAVEQRRARELRLLLAVPSFRMNYPSPAILCGLSLC